MTQKKRSLWGSIKQFDSKMHDKLDIVYKTGYNHQSHMFEVKKINTWGSIKITALLGVAVAIFYALGGRC